MFFLYAKVTILSFISFISFISGKGNIRKYTISASQTIHLDHVNDIFRLQKQYVYESHIFRQLDIVELTNTKQLMLF